MTDVDNTELDEPVTKKIDLLSINVISLVDRFCFLAPFNCRMTLEAKVPIDHRRSAYKNIKSIIESDEECEQFRDAWIEWVRSNPQDPESGDEGQPSKRMLSVYGDSDDSGSERDSEMMQSAKPTGKGKRREVDDSSLAATAMKDGAGIRDDDILQEGTAGGLQDEDNAVAAAEGIARRAPKSPAKAAASAAAGATAGNGAPAKAATPAAAGAAAGNGAPKSPAKAAAAAAAGAAAGNGASKSPAKAAAAAAAGAAKNA